jgi:two-component system OmpR family response regulator
MRALVIEDEVKMAGLLKRALETERFAVDIAGTGSDALWRLAESVYDVILLDVMLPDGDGFDLCRQLREKGVWSPVLMLTARGIVDDRVRGLDAGADDYLAKPFAFPELFARIRALLRRGAKERPAVLRVGALELDPAAHEARAAGKSLELTAKEYALLEYLMRHQGEVRTRTDIIEHVWDWAYDGVSNVVDVYVGYVRAKLRDSKGAPVIDTVRGVGYRLRSPA